MILPIGTKVRSLRTSSIVGEIRGYGALFVPKKDALNPTVTYLVWQEGMQGSSSIGWPYLVHVLDVDQVEEEESCD